MYFLLELNKNGEVNYRDLRKIYFIYINNYYTKIIKGDNYKKVRRYDGFLRKLEYLKTGEPLDKLLDFLDVEDSKNIHLGSLIKVNLTKEINKVYRSKEVKDQYICDLDIPFYKKEEDGLTLYKFNHSGYPYIILEEEPDLSITRFAVNEYIDEKIKEIIVFDFKTFKRYSVQPIKEARLTDTFKIIKTIDSRLTPRFTSYENCRECTNFELCKKLSKINIEEGEEYVIKAWETEIKE